MRRHLGEAGFVIVWGKFSWTYFPGTVCHFHPQDIVETSLQVPTAETWQLFNFRKVRNTQHPKLMSWMSPEHSSHGLRPSTGFETEPAWFLEDFKADQSKRNDRVSTKAACLLMPCLHTRMLLLASKSPCSHTTCSYRRGTDFFTSVDWGWGLHIIFMSVRCTYCGYRHQSEVSRRGGSLFPSGPGSSSSKKTFNFSETLCSRSDFAWACLHGFCQCEDTVGLIARPCLLDPQQGYATSPVCLY